MMHVIDLKISDRPPSSTRSSNTLKIWTNQQAFMEYMRIVPPCHCITQPLGPTLYHQSAHTHTHTQMRARARVRACLPKCARFSSGSPHIRCCPDINRQRQVSGFATLKGVRIFAPPMKPPGMPPPFIVNLTLPADPPPMKELNISNGSPCIFRADCTFVLRS